LRIRVGKLALLKRQRYAQAKQFKRAQRSLKTLKTFLGRVIRDIARRIKGNEALEKLFAHPLMLARRVHAQNKKNRNLRRRKGSIRQDYKNGKSTLTQAFRASISMTMPITTPSSIACVPLVIRGPPSTRDFAARIEFGEVSTVVDSMRRIGHEIRAGEPDTETFDLDLGWPGARRFASPNAPAYRRQSLPSTVAMTQTSSRISDIRSVVRVRGPQPDPSDHKFGRLHRGDARDADQPQAVVEAGAVLELDHRRSIDLLCKIIRERRRLDDGTGRIIDRPTLRVVLSETWYKSRDGRSKPTSVRGLEVRPAGEPSRLAREVYARYP
jgi:hypothetical protein